MKVRALGSSGIRVSQLGFGTWGIAGDSYGPVDPKEIQRSLNLALEKGITLYDTSILYGEGRSEEILGEVFSSKRDKIILATKFGSLPHRGRTMPQDFSTEHMEYSIHTSLKRLKTDYIDIYQFHSPSLEVFENQEVFHFLEKLKRDGKIRAIGISARTPDDALIAIQKYPFDSVQVNFNLIDHRAIDNGFLELAGKKQIGVIARTPLCFGFLSGTLNTDPSKFAPNDHRRNFPQAQLERWGSASKVFDHLFRRNNCKPADYAIKFCVTPKSVSSVIPGMLSRQEVEKNLLALELPEIHDEDWQEIRTLYQSNIFFDPSLRVKVEIVPHPDTKKR